MPQWITPPRAESDPIFRIVPLKERVLARLIDTLQYWITYFVSNFFFAFLISLAAPSYAKYSVGAAALFSLGWFLLRDGLAGGANIGKNNREIMVIAIDRNEPCSMSRSFARNIVSDISAYALFIQLAGMVPIATLYSLVLIVDIWRITKSPGGRRIGDVIARTQVVYMDDWIRFKSMMDDKQRKGVSG